MDLHEILFIMQNNEWFFFYLRHQPTFKMVPECIWGLGEIFLQINHVVKIEFKHDFDSSCIAVKPSNRQLYIYEMFIIKLTYSMLHRENCEKSINQFLNRLWYMNEGLPKSDSNQLSCIRKHHHSSQHQHLFSLCSK